jgi:hypothetical protein
VTFLSVIYTWESRNLRYDQFTPFW